MTTRAGLVRRLARALAGHAGRVLPPSPAKDEWAAAMCQETEAIEDGGASLRWALGCVYAGYAERIEAMAIVDTVAVRGLLVFFIALQVSSCFFATVITVAYKTGHMGTVRAMAGQMPGDDYHPVIPLMNAIPWWVHALWVSAGILYLFAAGFLFTWRRGIAFPVFTAGFGLTMIAKLSSIVVIADAGLQPVVARSGTAIGRMIQAIPEFILPLAIILVLWLMWRTRPSTGLLA